jgi:hypothetical protein
MFIPYRRWTILAAFCWLTFLIVVFSDTATPFIISIPVYLLLIIWIASLIIRAIVTVALMAGNRLQTNRVEQINLLNFGFESLALVLSVSLLVFQVPTILRLKLSESALKQYVLEVQTKYPTKKMPGSKRSVGLFEVRETELLEGKIVRMITAADFLDDTGLVYSPDRVPPVRGEDGYRHLYGDWWYWHRSW